MTESPTLSDRALAAIRLLQRTGALSFQIRYQDDEKPIVWLAVTEYNVDRNGRPVKQSTRVRYKVAADLDPESAIFRLCDEVVDGAVCVHCNRPSGFTADASPQLLDEVVCWYQWDPELKVYRRGCEGN